MDHESSPLTNYSRAVPVILEIANDKLVADVSYDDAFLRLLSVPSSVEASVTKTQAMEAFHDYGHYGQNEDLLEGREPDIFLARMEQLEPVRDAEPRPLGDPLLTWVIVYHQYLEYPIGPFTEETGKAEQQEPTLQDVIVIVDATTGQLVSEYSVGAR